MQSNSTHSDLVDTIAGLIRNNEFLEPAAPARKKKRKVERIFPGKCFGWLIVLAPFRANEYREIEWFCQCKCGSYTTVRASALRRRKTISCGCYNFRNRPIPGERYGRLIVVERHQRGAGKSYWSCLCTCGCMKVVRSDHLLDGSTNSCGCLRAEIRRRESTCKIEYQGQHHSISNFLSKHSVVSRSLFYGRRSKDWSVCDAALTPARRNAVNARVRES
jgi:hypothetical protein